MNAEAADDVFMRRDRMITDIEQLVRETRRETGREALDEREAGIGTLADWIWALAHGEVNEETTLEVKAKLWQL